MKMKLLPSCGQHVQGDTHARSRGEHLQKQGAVLVICLISLIMVFQRCMLAVAGTMPMR
jgi:hypothetical protein